MARKKLNVNESVANVAAQMCEGNPGAIAALSSILTKREDGLLVVLSLDDMNIRGCQIWVAYKDWAGGDVDKLAKGAFDRDQSMIDMVNERSGIEEVATHSGASDTRYYKDKEENQFFTPGPNKKFDPL